MFSKYLSEKIERWNLLKHPFYQAWMKGELTREQLKNYAVQYYPYVSAFPRFVSGVHSLCEDALSRTELARNLADEEGVTGKDHPSLWRNFAKNVGASDFEIESIKPSRASEKLLSTYFELTRSSYCEGLASLFAYEYQIPEISKTKIEGLKKHYGIDSKEALEFFEVHELADRYHSEACVRALDRLPERHRDNAISAGTKSAQALWEFLSESYAVA